MTTSAPERPVTTRQQARPVRVALVNDCELVAAGLTSLLAVHRDRVCFREHLHGIPPPGSADVLLFDPFLTPNPSGSVLELMARTSGAVLLYSWTEDRDQIEAATALGAAGFVSKSASAAEVMAAAETAARGLRAGQQRTSPPRGRSRRGGAAVLTVREAEVVAYIAQGLSNVEIAERCHLSINSVKTYIRSAYRKLGVTARSQAVLWAVQHGGTR